MRNDGRQLEAHHDRDGHPVVPIVKKFEALSLMKHDSGYRAILCAVSSSVVVASSHRLPGKNWRGIAWYFQDSRSDASSSDEEHECTRQTTEGANATKKTLIEKEQVTKTPMKLQLDSWTMDWGTEFLMADDATSRLSSLVTTLSFSSTSCSSPSSSACDDMVSPLDPEKPPNVVFSRKGSRDEGTSTRSLSLTLGSLTSNLDESMSNDRYSILMSRDEDGNPKESAITDTDGAQNAATALSAHRNEMEVRRSPMLQGQMPNDECSASSPASKPCSAIMRSTHRDLATVSETEPVNTGSSNVGW